MNVVIKPGVTEIEVSGLYPGQVVSVIAKAGAMTSPSTSYTAPAATTEPEAPVVSD
jgi:hypothetical protein